MAFDVLREPLTREQIQPRLDENNQVTVVVPVSLGSIIDADIESFNDLLSQKITGSDLLMNIAFRLVGIEGDEVMLLEVTGDVSECYEWDDEDDGDVEPNFSGNWMRDVLNGKADAE